MTDESRLARSRTCIRVHVSRDAGQRPESQHHLITRDSVLEPSDLEQLRRDIQCDQITLVSLDCLDPTGKMVVVEDIVADIVIDTSGKPAEREGQSGHSPQG